MDSLTQITLGAACGELVLGRKIGNRAMLWGAVGGTIPDLDVLAHLFVDPISALAFHRAITHSFFFAFTFPFAIAALAHRLYRSGLYQKPSFKAVNISFWLLLLMAIVNGGAWVQRGQFNWIAFLFSGIVSLVLAALFWWMYYRRPQSEVQATYRQWVLLFFWSIFTHPLLDSCTAYGTQLFQPFSDYRVVFDNIAVVDPLYTLPFLFCLIIASRMSRQSRWRRFFNRMGIAVSCLYLLFTFYNKWKVTQVFRHSFAAERLEYKRMVTVPTILNNFLWQGIAEGDTAFYQGHYSIFDAEPVVRQINVLPKNHHLLGRHAEDPDIQTIRWVTNQMYSLTPRPDGQLQFNHLRYGLLRPEYTGPRDYVFYWVLYPDSTTGEWTARMDPNSRELSQDDLQQFWNRIWGETPN